MPAEQPLPRRASAPPSLRDADDAFEGTIVPFSRYRASDPEPDSGPARPGRRQPADSGYEPRRSRPRRRGAVRRARADDTRWYERYGLGLAAGGLALGVAGVGTVAMLALNRGAPQATPSTPPTAVAGAPTAGDAPQVAGSEGPLFANVATPSAPSVAARPPAPPEVRSVMRELQPDHTVVQGDTLAAIATKYNTSVVRIQAFNGIEDPRALSIGQKLVIPPPLPAAR